MGLATIKPHLLGDQTLNLNSLRRLCVHRARDRTIEPGERQHGHPRCTRESVNRASRRALRDRGQVIPTRILNTDRLAGSDASLTALFAPPHLRRWPGVSFHRPGVHSGPGGSALRPWETRWLQQAS